MRTSTWKWPNPSGVAAWPGRVPCPGTETGGLRAGQHPGRALAGPNWEIYGHWQEDWNEDPAKIRTEVFYLLEGEGRAESGGDRLLEHKEEQ